MITRRRAVARLGVASSASSLPRASRLRSPLARIGRVVPLRRATREALPRDRVHEIAGAKAVLSLAGAAVAFLLARPPAAYAAAPLFAAAGWRFPDLTLARRGRDRDALVRARLPDALDLMAACSVAGMGVDQALRTVAPETPGPLGDAFRETLRALDAGMPRERAYEVLTSLAPAPEVRSLVRSLRRAERYGTPVASALVAQAREVRAQRRLDAEEAARAAPVKMLFPLVVCFLPAFIVLTVAPIVLSALRSFRMP